MLCQITQSIFLMDATVVPFLQVIYSGPVLWLCRRRRYLALLSASAAASPQDLQIHPQSTPRVHRESNMHLMKKIARLSSYGLAMH